MSVHIRAEQEAAAQMRAAFLWWRENRPDALGLPRQELHDIIALLRRTPEMGKVYTRYRGGKVRRVLLTRSAYHLYYEYDADSEELTVLAFWGAVRRRRPPLLTGRR